MFLAFGWMLIAGGMNTYRNASYAWDAAHRYMVTISGGRTFIFPGGSGSVVQRTITTQGGVTITTGPTAGFQITQGLTPATTPTWSNVSADIWTRLGWSVFLLLAAITGLIVLWRHLSKPLSASAWARARLFAIAAFGIYTGFHLYWFAIEML